MRPARVRVWRSEVFTHHWWIDYYGHHGYLIDTHHRPTHAAALAHALAAVGLAPHPDDCDCDSCCTHEITVWGRCAGCGVEIQSGVREVPGCAGRGWYHDGSETEEALAQGREPRPCPHCSGAVGLAPEEKR